MESTECNYSCSQSNIEVNRGALNFWIPLNTSSCGRVLVATDSDMQGKCYLGRMTVLGAATRGASSSGLVVGPVQTAAADTYEKFNAIFATTGK
jgi:hypothetical protein